MPLVLNGKQIEVIHPEIKKTGVKSDIIIPLINRNKSVGVITIESKKKKFTQKDITLLQLLGPLSTLALNKANFYEKLNDSIKTRDLFISLASHELKTPITTAYTYTKIIQKKMEKGEGFNPLWIDTISNEMLRLNELVNGFLEIQQIKTGKLNYEFEKTNIKKIIKRAMDNFYAKYKERKISVQDKPLNSHGYIYADSNRLIQVFFNLLDNAAKHSDPESVISIVIEEKRNKIVVSVKDEGKGIPEKDIENVFDSFYKGSNSNPKGMGLGLFLTKQIVKRHRGQLKVESQINKGTTISVFLPRLD
jgi:signal transduction histidine kinase